MEKRRPGKSKREKSPLPNLDAIKQQINSPLNFSNIFDKSSEVVDVPDGFKSVNIAAAIMEFGKPIIELCAKFYDDMNVAMKMTMEIWNYLIEVENGNVSKKQDVIKFISSTLNLKNKKAEQFLDEMSERRLYLLPAEIQPKIKMNMLFMRVEKDVVIKKVDYKKKGLNTAEVPADAQDLKIIKDLKQMDTYIKTETEYDEWEEFYLDLEDNCINQYKKWLVKKGAEGRFPVEVFGFFVSIYMNFVYRYEHSTRIVMKTATFKNFSEFFESHVIRKAIVEPESFPYCPTAIIYFYTYLKEMKYITQGSYKKIIKQLDKQETNFIRIIKQRN